MAKSKRGKTKPSEPDTPSPPPDNPLVRHEEMDLDRLSPETVAAVVGSLAALATNIAAPGAGKKSRPPRGAAPVSVHGGEMAQLARQRLTALEHGADMPTASVSAPALPISQTANWTQLGPSAIPNGQTPGDARALVTGRVTSIVIDPTDSNILYVGSAQGGVWKTTDRGRTWKPMSDDELSLAIGALVMDPSDHNVLYAGTGEGNFSGDSYYGSGVLRSATGGGTWAMFATATFAGSRFSRIAITQGTPQYFLAATSGGLFKSTDAGSSWAPLGNGLPASGAATDVAIDPSNYAIAFAAFWGQGIYRSTNADAANSTWTALAGGLALGGSTRVALAISPSAPSTVYALLAGPSNPTPSLSYLVNRFYRSIDGGDNWQALPLPGGNIGANGFYNLSLLVDPTTPDIVYLSAFSLWKATRNATTNRWDFANVGMNIHADNHALAIDPTNHLVVYAGTDGGLYRSTDGGATWDDSVNEGLCITQFEFISQHPTSDALVLGGTQDNGTEQFRNSPVFYHSDDGDGGSCAIDPTTPTTMLSTYYVATPKRSSQAGLFSTWVSVANGLAGECLFYPPMTLDDTNSNHVAFGTDSIYLDPAQGTTGWPNNIALPGISSTTRVSAIHYVNSSLIYTATNEGEVFKLSRAGTTWTAQAIHAAPLPTRYVWDVIARPDDASTVILVMSGFGTPHVWRGKVGATATDWTDVSGAGGKTRLPDIPVNALAIDPNHPDFWYIGTDIGVFRTFDAGTTWSPFSNALPNCAVFDLKLHAPARLLRAATHGRGLWEIPLDARATPAVDLAVRDHIMDTGRLSPSPSNIPAAWDEPLQHVNMSDPLFFWHCADIKIDTIEGAPPTYQMPAADVDYLAFESDLAHRNPARGQVSRVYLQLRNRGIKAANGVQVKILYADASLGLPDLPADFWTAFPGDSTDPSNWRPIGSAKLILVLAPFEPQVLEWDWPVPTSAADHSCLLVVMQSADDPIPAANRLFDTGQVVTLEKRVGLKNLHVVTAAASAPHWAHLNLHGGAAALHTLRFLPAPGVSWQVGIVLPKGAQVKLKLDGVFKKTLTAVQMKALTTRLGTDESAFDTSAVYLLNKPDMGGALVDLKLPGGLLKTMLLLVRPTGAKAIRSITLTQETAGKIVGGSTFALRAI